MASICESVGYWLPLPFAWSIKQSKTKQAKSVTFSIGKAQHQRHKTATSAGRMWFRTPCRIWSRALVLLSLRSPPLAATKARKNPGRCSWDLGPSGGQKGWCPDYPEVGQPSGRGLGASGQAGSECTPPNWAPQGWALRIVLHGDLNPVTRPTLPQAEQLPREPGS